MCLFDRDYWEHTCKWRRDWDRLCTSGKLNDFCFEKKLEPVVDVDLPSLGKLVDFNISERGASLHSKMFSHFSFHFRKWWYKPLLMVQSILGLSMYRTNWVCWLEECLSHLCCWLVILYKFAMVMLYYFCGALDNSGHKNPYSVHLLQWSCLWWLMEGWSFYWNAAGPLSNEFRIVHRCAGST